MAHDEYNAGTAAQAVGYESPSQFSREFNRFFGVTPPRRSSRQSPASSPFEVSGSCPQTISTGGERLNRNQAR